MSNPVRILSIDGGGIRGIMPARVLQTIEDTAGKRTCELFDLIAGTSTGGILACGLAQGNSAKALADQYVENGGAIFSRTIWRIVTTLNGYTGPKYDAAPLERMIRKTLGSAWLSEVTAVDLLIPSYCIELPRPTDFDGDGIASTRTPMFFKTWKARGVGLVGAENREEFDFPLWQIARATSAAETYFSPAQIQNRVGENYVMTDGGTFANVPGLCAWVGAKQRFPEATDFVIVSLGTGSLERAIDGAAAVTWGDIRWLDPILSILMDGQADTATFVLSQLFGASCHRFDISLGTDLSLPYTVREDFDDATPDNIRRIETLSARLIEQSRSKLGAITNILMRNST